MPVKTLQDPAEVLQTIQETEKPLIVHYWAPWEGPESPYLPIFWEADKNRGEEIDIVIVDTGFVHPQHTPDEIPLTVLYKGGNEVDTAPFDPQAIEDLLERA